MTGPNPVRRLAQVAVALLCGFLVVRTAFLEPFGVPTGSMAPALLGNHRTVNCPRCDFAVTVGEPGPDARAIKFDACRCPNCEQAVDLSEAREVPGDRLMVDKTVFEARGPRRWEVAVFRCPADLTKPYVKRVVGLPGELLELSGGDVYADGELLRKTVRQVRETRVLAFAQACAPPGGWGDRWLVQPLADPKLPPTARTADRPADATILQGGAIHLDGVGQPEGVGLTYRHFNLDTKREEPLHDFLAYNGQPADRQRFARSATAPWGDPVHDFVAVFDLEVVAGSGTFAVRLCDNVDTVSAVLQVASGPEWRSLSGTIVGHDGGLNQVAPLSLSVGSTYRVEFAFVDRRAMLAIDGREVLPPLDLPADPVGQPRKRQTARPVQFGVRGASVVVKNFELFRDLHYAGAPKAPRGWRLPAGEFFVLGDNTASSHDSRAWEVGGAPAPGVPECNFLGKPFLIHQPMRPARLTLNGHERRLQSPDWSRVRWLR